MMDNEMFKINAMIKDLKNDIESRYGLETSQLIIITDCKLVNNILTIPTITYKVTTTNLEAIKDFAQALKFACDRLLKIGWLIDEINKAK